MNGKQPSKTQALSKSANVTFSIIGHLYVVICHSKFEMRWVTQVKSRQCACACRALIIVQNLANLADGDWKIRVSADLLLIAFAISPPAEPSTAHAKMFPVMNPAFLESEMIPVANWFAENYLFGGSKGNAGHIGSGIGEIGCYWLK